jgi:membrane-bound lytic murein transglycosylase A
MRTPLLFKITTLLLMTLLLAGCPRKIPKRPVPETLPLIRLSESRLPTFSDDMVFDKLRQGIDQSLSYLQKIPPERRFTFGKDQYTTRQMAASLEAFSRFIASGPSGRELNRHIKKHYIVYQSRGHNETREVLFTGYYEPELRGSPVESEKYPHPVYGLPDDLITVDLSLFSTKYRKKVIGRLRDKTVVPYYSRKEIVETPALADSAKPVAWVEDPVALFFLHVQGSGKIAFENGDIINVHYHGTNGHAYKSIGRHLIDTGKIKKENMSMQAIYSYLQDNPDHIPEVLNFNPSFVFFETVEAGPIGCIMTELVPGRSIALDKSPFPPAALAFIRAQKPMIDENDTITGWTEFSRFVLNHDTGGAIKGPGRADIFWGGGKEAEIAAGHLNHTGTLYFLMLKPEKG